MSGLLGGVRAAIRNDPSSSVLKLLQLVDFSRTTTTPSRTTVFEVRLNNAFL